MEFRVLKLKREHDVYGFGGDDGLFIDYHVDEQRFFVARQAITEANRLSARCFQANFNRQAIRLNMPGHDLDKTRPHTTELCGGVPNTKIFAAEVQPEECP